MKLTNPLRHPPGVPRVEKPRAEGRFHLSDGRGLGYAEFGDPTGPVVLWFHGTLGVRRQFPVLGRRAAENLGLRVIIVERPGTGLSDSYRYSAVTDWVADMAQVADALDAERLSVVGLSGGGAYALACGALPPLVDRVATVAVLDGTVPAVGPEATGGGATDVARRFNPVLTQLRRPLAVPSTVLLAPLSPSRTTPIAATPACGPRMTNAFSTTRKSRRSSSTTWSMPSGAAVWPWSTMPACWGGTGVSDWPT
jgi:pimeloyl-ACP methyl ester carboxylesterase